MGSHPDLEESPMMKREMEPGRGYFYEGLPFFSNNFFTTRR